MQSTPLRNRKRQWRHSQWLACPGPHPSCLDGHTDVSGGSQSSFLLSFSPPPPSNRLFAHPLQTCHLSHYSSALASCIPQYKPGESVSTSQALRRIFDSFNSLKFFFLLGCSCQLPWHSVQTEALYSMLCFQRSHPAVSVTE